LTLFLAKRIPPVIRSAERAAKQQVGEMVIARNLKIATSVCARSNEHLLLKQAILYLIIKKRKFVVLNFLSSNNKVDFFKNMHMCTQSV
jgi:hypothetical protein